MDKNLEYQYIFIQMKLELMIECESKKVGKNIRKC